MNTIHVWERHRLDAQNLGQCRGDVVHEFESLEAARKFMYIVESGHPEFSRHYVRFIELDDHTLAVDFGSYSDFFVIVTDFPTSVHHFFGGEQN